MREFVTRAEARALGLPEYFTGDPCRYGHVSPRRTENCQCVACIEEYVMRRLMGLSRHFNETMIELIREPRENVEDLRRHIEQFGSLEVA